MVAAGAPFTTNAIVLIFQTLLLFFPVVKDILSPCFSIYGGIVRTDTSEIGRKQRKKIGTEIQAMEGRDEALRTSSG